MALIEESYNTRAHTHTHLRWKDHIHACKKSDHTGNNAIHNLALLSFLVLFFMHLLNRWTIMWSWIL